MPTLRELIPKSSASSFAAAPTSGRPRAVQTALVRALEIWPHDPPRDPKGWLITSAWRKFLDQVRSDGARATREEQFATEPAPEDGPSQDDTLWLYFSARTLR